ncbi:MAG: hypothetical protein ACP5JJ_17445 [Anaerolineae bacterium]
MKSDLAKGEPKPEERGELEESTRGFISHLFEAGVSLARIPMSFVPKEPRSHLEEASREAVRGLTALAREVTDSLDRIAEPPKE